jgi:hypothetical protein
MVLFLHRCEWEFNILCLDHVLPSMVTSFQEVGSLSLFSLSISITIYIFVVNKFHITKLLSS